VGKAKGGKLSSCFSGYIILRYSLWSSRTITLLLELPKSIPITIWCSTSFISLVFILPLFIVLDFSEEGKLSSCFSGDIILGGCLL